MILENERLRVDIVPNWYEGMRFDRSVGIRSVVLDGEHEFCAVEQFEPGKGTGGVGLCCEFGIDDPIGFDDAAVGETFLKPGVGHLVKEHEDYRFAVPHIVRQEGALCIEEREGGMLAVWSAEELRGYACRVERDVSISGNTLIYKNRLVNTGKKPFSTSEYCHNFVNIDALPLSEDISLLTDSEPLNESVGGSFVTMGKYPSYLRKTGDDCHGVSSWVLARKSSGVSMREKDDFCAYKIAVWALEHVISAELFIKIRLEPGESAEWSRTYTFED